jgi:hypothetical protein
VYKRTAEARVAMIRRLEFVSLSNRHVYPAVLLVLIGFTNWTSLSAAATPALAFNEVSGGSGLNQNQNVGWRFDVLSPVYVTGLGWYDENHNGLGISHEVGIWDANGTLLTSIIVPSGTVSRLNLQYRMADINPLLLAAGAGYIVGGLNSDQSGDQLAARAFTIDSRLAFNHATYSGFTSTFGEPTLNSIGFAGFFGPMFEIDSIPEPTSYGLVVFSGIVLFFLRHLGKGGKIGCPGSAP